MHNSTVFPQKSVIIVDDGLGSSYSMLAAADFVKKKKPRLIVAAAPVASDTAYRVLATKRQIDKLPTLVRDPEQSSRSPPTLKSSIPSPTTMWSAACS